MRLFSFLLMMLFAISCLAQVQADDDVTGQISEAGEQVAGTVDQVVEQVSGSLSDSASSVADRVTETLESGLDEVTDKVIESKDEVVDSVTGGEEARKAEEEEEKKAAKYEGAGFAEKIAHSMVDAGVDTAAREAKQQVGTPLLKPIVNGIAKAAKKQMHKRVTNYMRDNSEEKKEGEKKEDEEPAAEGGIREKILSATGLEVAEGGIGDKILTATGLRTRRKRSVSDSASTGQPVEGGMVRRLIGGIKKVIFGKPSAPNAAQEGPADVQVFRTRSAQLRTPTDADQQTVQMAAPSEAVAKVGQANTSAS